MKINTILDSLILALVALILFLILISSTTSASINEIRITTSGNASFPAIYKDRIVWNEGSWRNSSIYMYNISTHKETKVTASKLGIHSDIFIKPVIFEDRIIWHDSRNGGYEYDIYMHNLSTNKDTQISKRNNSLDAFPAIYGDGIVWMDYHGGIYMYNLTTCKETQITADDGVYNPDIYGDRVVWVDMSVDGNPNIYMYEISTHKQIQITTSGSVLYNSVAIYGDRIVWADLRNSVVNWKLPGNGSGIKSDIYMYDLLTKKENQITTSGSAGSPDIYDNRIVWTDTRSNEKSDIYMYDISTKKQIQITTNKSAAVPVIYGNNVAWMDYRNKNLDIYMFSFLVNNTGKYDP